MNNFIFNTILTIFILIIAYRIYVSSESFQLRCIISDVNGNKYCVRDRAKLEMAADKLANVSLKLNKLIKHLGEKYPEKDNVKRLVKGYNPRKIYETLPTSEYTAYSENKGEKIAFCLDTEKNSKGRIIDDNTLMYVALHEVSHIATKSIGHGDEFWTNYKFILTEAKKINIYNPVDYKNNPARYCGMNITDNPYFDY